MIADFMCWYLIGCIAVGFVFLGHESEKQREQARRYERLRNRAIRRMS